MSRRASDHAMGSVKRIAADGIRSHAVMAQMSLAIDGVAEIRGEKQGRIGSRAIAMSQTITALVAAVDQTKAQVRLTLSSPLVARNVLTVLQMSRQVEGERMLQLKSKSRQTPEGEM